MASDMDRFIQKIEELKKDAELFKQTCTCQNNAAAGTTPRSNKRKSKRGANASPEGQLPNGTCCPSPSPSPSPPNVQASSKVRGNL